jgi:REP element-mobilizing transposase RayT
MNKCGAPAGARENRRVGSTHLSLHYHLVWSTKSREPWLAPESRNRVHEYLGGVIRGLGGRPHAVGGVGDHVHVFAGLRATHCLANVMRELKSEFSVWIKKEMRLHGFAWQEGYGAFTVSASSMERVRSYVLNQERHHRKTTFQEEYLGMLRQGLVEYDDRYLW